MRHAQYASVVVLVITRCFATDSVTRSTCTGTGWATTLYNKIRYYPMELKPVVKPSLCKFYKILNCSRSILLVELHFHCTLCGLNLCLFHNCIYLYFILITAPQSCRIRGNLLQTTHSTAINRQVNTIHISCVR